MAYPSQYQQPYPYGYQPQPQQPMDRLMQLQSQQQQYQTLPAPMPGAPQPPQINQGLLWVQGEAGAKSYLLAPNTTVLLMDSEGSRFYLKSTDNAGMPSLRIFEYSEVVQSAPQSQQTVPANLDDKYVTREEYGRLQAQYAEIIDKLDSFRVPVVASEDTRKPAAVATNKPRGKGGDSIE